MFIKAFFINPEVIIFPHQAVAAIHPPLKKTILFNRIQGVLRAAWAKMASWAVDLRDHCLMEDNERAT